MKILGFKIMLEEEYQMLKGNSDRFNDLYNCHYWFHKNPLIKKLLIGFLKGEITNKNIESVRDNLHKSIIELTPAEIQSGSSRVRWAYGLIKQLPETHEGRNSWILNYGSEFYTDKK